MDTNLILTWVGKIGAIVTALLASHFVFCFVKKIAKKGEEEGKKFVHNIGVQAQKKGRLSAQQNFISKTGIMYRFNRYDLKPSEYVLVRVFTGLLVSARVFLVSMSPLALIGLPIGYVGINVIFKILNNKDNEEMRMDIYNTYANLKIQLTSGIYIGDGLEYTYKIVQNKRYKEALKELLLNFSDKTVTSTEAVEIFRNRFDSKEIDKLCSMIEAFAEYGVSEHYLNEIMFTVQELLQADTAKAQHDIESKTGMIIFAFFVLVVALVAINMASTFDGIEMFM